MKGEVLSSQHTLLIDKIQIDICFNFHSSELSIFIEGKQFTHYHYSPQYKTFNYINLMDIARQSLHFYKTKHQEEKQKMKEDAGMSEGDEWENW